MTPKEAIMFLDSMRPMPTLAQIEHRREIVEAFRVLWASGPDEQTFSAAMRSLVIFPELSYIMAVESGPRVGHA